MTRGDEAMVSQAVSRDGTEIAYWTSGEGPPLVLVHGTTADHSRWRPLLPYLEPWFTVHAMDRRGRGASGDGPDYDVTREFYDVAAVIDAVSEGAGSAVDVYGHSFGGLCAFGGAASTSNVRKLVLYEGWPAADPEVLTLPADVEQRLDALLAQGDRDAVIETFMGVVVQLPEQDLRSLRAQPSWHARVAAAHTITREFRGIEASPFNRKQAAAITVPVLMLVGEDSPDAMKADPETVAAALPDARIAVLERQQHAADVIAPQVIADQLLGFLHEHT